MSIRSRIRHGLLAGAIGTAVFDAWLFARYRLRGGDIAFADWESSAGVTDWDGAPAPALVGKRAVQALTGRELPPERARLVNNLMHWGYGIGNGVQYGVVAGRLKKARIRNGLAFGTAVWGADYIVLPILKLYKPIWEYDTATLADDLSAHLVYGLATAAGLRVLSSH
jgi:hypothetical protein